MSELAEETACLVALVGLGKVGPARANWLMSTMTASGVVDALRKHKLPAELGRAPVGVTQEMVRRWGDELRDLELDRVLEPYHQAGISVVDATDHRWPFSLDPDPPAVLFAQGNLNLLKPDGQSVAIVGTRRCSAAGRSIAYELGAELAEAGVKVISGLASGIDGAAHRGTLDAKGSALGVVGTGLDVVYPAVNRRLWGDVGQQGLLIGEAILGATPERWRFPARNRLIAGLADAIVVVESHAKGGALLTADDAVERGKEVLAVPGSIRSRASDGTNRLLAEGAVPVLSVEDILAVLDMSMTRTTTTILGDEPPVHEPPRQLSLAGLIPELSPLGRQLLQEVQSGPVHVDDLLSPLGSALVDEFALAKPGQIGKGHSPRPSIQRVLTEVTRLESQGLVRLDGSTVVLVD